MAPPVNNKLPRITAAERQQRVGTIIELLLRGVTRREILQYVAKKTNWGVKPRTIDTYLQSANEWITQQSEIDRATELGKAISQLSDLYKRTVMISDYKTALAVRRETNRLLGLEQKPDENNKGTISDYLQSLHRYADEKLFK